MTEHLLTFYFSQTSADPNSCRAEHPGTLSSDTVPVTLLTPGVSGNSSPSWEPAQLPGFRLEWEEVHGGDLLMLGAAQLLPGLKKMPQRHLTTEGQAATAPCA